MHVPTLRKTLEIKGPRFTRLRKQRTQLWNPDGPLLLQGSESLLHGCIVGVKQTLRRAFGLGPIRIGQKRRKPPIAPIDRLSAMPIA